MADGGQREPREEPGGGPDPAEERPPDPEPVALQGWSQSPDLGAFVSTSAFHESFRPSCQVRRKGEQTEPSQLRGRTGFSEDLPKGRRVGVGEPPGVTCAWGGRSSGSRHSR